MKHCGSTEYGYYDRMKCYGRFDDLSEKHACFLKKLVRIYTFLDDFLNKRQTVASIIAFQVWCISCTINLYGPNEVFGHLVHAQRVKDDELLRTPHLLNAVVKNNHCGV